MLVTACFETYNVGAMANPVSFQREIEIKLDLGSFMNYLKLMGFLGQIDSESRQENAFFDTEDRRLAAAGWALRVRAERDLGLVTLKGLRTDVGGAAVREELETVIPRGRAIDCMNLAFDVIHLTVPPVEFVRQQFGELALALLVRFDNVRQCKNFRMGDRDYLLEIDKTEFSDGSVDYELEMELPNTDVIEAASDSLRKLFGSLDIPYRPQPQGKFVRALQKAGLG